MLFRPLSFSPRFSSVVGRCAVAGVVLSGLGSSAFAQPAQPKAAVAPVPSAAQQRSASLTRFKEEVKTNAAGALAKAEQFLTDRPELSAWDRIQFTGDVAHALYFNGAPADKTANARTAIALLQDALEQNPVIERRLYLVQNLAQVQRSSGDLSGSQLTLTTNWPVALRAKEGHWSRELLQEYRLLLRAQKRPEEAADITRELIEARPEEALHWWTRAAGKGLGWYGKGDVNLMVDALLEAGNRAEALRWAKLGWQMSEFSKQGITEASATLAKCWAGRA